MIGEWLRSSLRCYFGNASTIRDFRVQLRGNRAILLWGFYLLVLIGFTMIVYSGNRTDTQTSIVSAQSRLREFYQAVMILMAVMMNLISPALTAGSIVMERQRHSLDLVFSAPVTPKYYLVGKMLSSYRYVWMLLVLSLPVTSACVVLGGATWSDVISAYLILSFNGLIYTSMALLLSTLSRQPVAAVVWSYFAAIFYSIVTGVFAGSSAIFSSFGGRTLEAPFTVTLNPYLVVQAAPTHTTVYGYEVPNWVLGALFSVLFSKIMLLAAGSAMSGFGAPETKSLRIHGLVYSFLIAGIIAYASSPIVSMMRMSRTTSMGVSPPTYSTWQYGFDLTFGWLLAPLVMFLPFLTCYGSDAERRYWSDGVLRFKNAFLGTPSGGLIFILLSVLATYAGIAAANMQLGMAAPSAEILFWGMAFWAFMWSLGRFASSFNIGLRGARSLHFTLMMALVALPVPFFSAMGAFSSSNAGIWDIYILRPLIGADDNRQIAWVYGALMVAGTLIVTFIAETNASRKGVLQRYTA